MEAMKRFMVMQPLSFNGEPNVEVAEHWLSSRALVEAHEENIGGVGYTRGEEG